MPECSVHIPPSLLNIQLMNNTGFGICFRIALKGAVMQD